MIGYSGQMHHATALVSTSMWLLVITAGVAGREVVRNTSLLLDQLLRGYDKRLRPGFGGPPLVVDVNINVRSMGPISEHDMAYQMDCYFRQSWVDTRLKFTGSLTTLPVSVTILDLLWKPDTHFFNGQRSYLHTVTTPNKLLRINQDGRILYSMRLTIKASCPMHLERFPMDIQTCPLAFGSHGYDVNDLQYVWTYGPGRSIKMASDMTLSQFDLIGFTAGNVNKTTSMGVASMLYINFSLKRHMGYFMINVYAPSTLLVVISWVGFWINREATADRIALGVTTVLTMAFLGIDNRRDMPKVSYSTALDYFVAVAFAFVLATIIQFAGVHFFTKHGSGEHIVEPVDSDSEDEEDEDNDTWTTDGYTPGGIVQANTCVVKAKENGEASVILSYPTGHPYAHKESCCSKFWNCIIGSSTYRQIKSRSSSHQRINSVSAIDRVARCMFPITFAAFQIGYWAIYMQYRISKQQQAL